MTLRILAAFSACFVLHACASPGPATQVATHSADLGADRAFMHAASTWDTDGDAVVTCDEWKAYAARMFTTGDKNGDGALDAEEYQALGGRDRLFVSVSLGHFDGNGDGKLSKQEMVDKPNPAYAYLDKDKDCRLTFTELSVGQPSRKKKTSVTEGQHYPGEKW